LEEDYVCSSDRADIQVAVISDQGELLAILPMFLYLKRDSQFFWEILWFHCSMGGCPNQLGERLYDSLA
jgi:hypothetical protein